MRAGNSLSQHSAFSVRDADEMAGMKIVRALNEVEARAVLRKVAAGEFEQVAIDDKQVIGLPRRRSGPVSVVAAEVKPGVVAVVWYIGYWSNPLTAEIVWAEELGASRVH